MSVPPCLAWLPATAAGPHRFASRAGTRPDRGVVGADLPVQADSDGNPIRWDNPREDAGCARREHAAPGGSAGRDRRVGVGRADLRVEVQVEEDLGDALRGDGVEVAADLVERAAEWLAGAVAAGADPHHAAADEAQGVRVAARLAGPLPDRADRRVQAGQVGHAAADPAVRQPAGAPPGAGDVAAEQQRRVGTLHRLGVEAGRRDLVEAAVELDHVLGPQGPQRRDELLGPRAALLHGNPDRLELLAHPAEAEAHVEPAARDRVERGELLGEQGGREERQVRDREAEADPAGLPGEVGQRDDRVVDAAVDGRAGARVRPCRDEQALEGPDRPVAELLGAAHQPHLVLGRRPRAGDGNAEAPQHAPTPFRPPFDADPAENTAWTEPAPLASPPDPAAHVHLRLVCAFSRRTVWIAYLFAACPTPGSRACAEPSAPPSWPPPPSPAGSGSGGRTPRRSPPSAPSAAATAPFAQVAAVASHARARACRIVSGMPAREQVLEVAGREVKITNPDKVFFPRTGHTKLDLVRYYLAVADGALRGVMRRPMALKRFVNGAEGEFFFQKRAPSSRPEWTETVELSFPSGRTADEIVVSDAAQLAWVVNLGCIDLNPHPVRAADLDHPDELRVDLDPVPGV